jgi:hypothetical protein
LLSTWKIVPGSQAGGEFDSDTFTQWLSQTEKIVQTSGHYDVAMIQLGGVLINAPEEPDGLWIYPTSRNVVANRWYPAFST